jgi:iron complex outermembrane receptor protein
LLTRYHNNINNYAVFGNFEFNPFKGLRIVTSLRYDLFRYDFDNSLTPSSFSGSPDTVNRFQKLSVKFGGTYSLSASAGFYANYSQGFVPPQVTEMYKGVKVPELKPSMFFNYEIGGWWELIKNKLTADISIYRLEGTNEIISVRMDDGSSQNMNAGKTIHEGIEAGVVATPVKEISLRISGAWSRHRFVEFVEKGTSYNGNEMNGAPRWMHNAEVWYRPRCLNGVRVGVEWQKIGNYYLDALNTAKYDGYDVFHLRAGYKYQAFEFWVNLLNVMDRYYAYTASKSNSGYSYTPADPRNFNLGFSYDFGAGFKKP